MSDRPEAHQLRRCFSTLGCADLALPEISELAGEFRIPGIELRGIGRRMDLPEYCAAQGLTPSRMGEICRRHQTRPVVAGSSVKLASASEKDRAELLAFGAWADAWEIPYVRVFGGGSWEQPLSEAEWLCAAELVNWWRRERASRGWRVELLLETHDAFSASAPCLQLNERLAEPLNLIWDSHHTWRVGGESLETTWKRLGPLIRHVHLKDSVDRPSARHPYTYVLPGDGQMPMAEVIALLKRRNFDGFVSLEWERAWHPDLPPLREALNRLQDLNWYENGAVEKATSTAGCGLDTPGAGPVASPADPYGWWRGAAESLLRPLAVLMLPDKADLPLRGQASNHGRQADRLESFARPCLLAAHWLASEPAPEENLSRKEIAEWFRRGLVIGTDPASPEFWGPTANHHQHTVEMAGLTLALQIARPDLWEPLDGSERKQVARWLAGIRGAGLHRNNHMFFNVMTLAFLAQEGHGRRADEPVMRHLLDAIESMALGGGWFIDGMNETVDYYQAYAFHYYGSWWSKLYGDTDRGRAQRWMNWLGQFLKDYIHFFAASGENPPFGRSMCYRFAASAPFALAEHCGVSAIPPGQARRVCTQNLRFFFNRPIFQEQGALSLGWTDEFPALAEAYSCAGSAYWAAKGFAPLLLARRHAFWQSEEKPLPAEEDAFEMAIPQAGLVVRSHAGEVEVLNNAHGITVGNLKFGAWKWGKLSFRSGVGGEIPPAENLAPLDAALTAEFRDGSVCGRHQCQPIVVSPAHCASAYGLGDRFSQNHVSVETRLWWKAGWQLHWHYIQPYQAARLRLGTFSLPLSDPDAAEVELADTFGSARAGERGVAVQSLRGFDLLHRQDSNPRLRTHLLTWHSLVLLAETGWVTGEHDLLALTWVGKLSDEALPWSVFSSEPGRLALRHSLLGSWIIESPGLPLCSATETGRRARRANETLAK
jgi:sugar phosphate isomerase/epimerase